MKNIILILAVLLAGCREDAAENVPPPAPITAETTAYFCHMNILEMPGPKAQIRLKGEATPLFFAQVRDGVAYLKSPEKTAPITAFYVSDMGKAPSWDAPGADNWLLAKDAYFVVGANVKGGMGAPELAPFGTVAAARAFSQKHGGRIERLDDIPAEAVLGGVEHTGNMGN